MYLKSYAQHAKDLKAKDNKDSSVIVGPTDTHIYKTLLIRFIYIYVGRGYAKSLIYNA